MKQQLIGLLAIFAMVLIMVALIYMSYALGGRKNKVETDVKYIDKIGTETSWQLGKVQSIRIYEESVHIQWDNEILICKKSVEPLLLRWTESE